MAKVFLAPNMLNRLTLYTYFFQTNLLLHILDPSLVEEAFKFLDLIRLPQDPPHTLTIASRERVPTNDITGYTSPEQALDRELASPVIHDVFDDSRHGRKLLDDVGSDGGHSYKAKLEEGLSEFCVNSCYKSTDEPEPWDLIQLNIKAGLMSLSSKVKSFTRKFLDEEEEDSEKAGSLPPRKYEGEKISTKHCPPGSSPRVASGKSRQTELASSNLSVDVSPCDDSGIVADHKGEEEAGVVSPSGGEAISSRETDEGGKLGDREGRSEALSSKASAAREETPEADWFSEVRPSIRKLRHTIDGLMRTARLIHSVFRLKESQENSELSHAIKYRRDICFSQAVSFVPRPLSALLPDRTN